MAKAGSTEEIPAGIAEMTALLKERHRIKPDQCFLNRIGGLTRVAHQHSTRPSHPGDETSGLPACA